MKYQLSLSSQAEAVVSEAAIWYEQQSSGLGERFLMAMDRSLRDISEHPLVYGFRTKNVRGYSMSRFPFRIMFVVESEAVYVISILHSSMNSKI